MGVVGLLLIALGLVLLLAEAHVSASGVLAGLGGLSAAAGLGVVVVAGGAGLLVAIPLAVGGAAAAATVVLLAVPRVVAARRAPVQAGPQRLLGSEAVVRSWHGVEGQVEADGGLWRARLQFAGELDGVPVPVPGETVIVEQVRGLTLAVRRHEPWEVDLL